MLAMIARIAEISMLRDLIDAAKQCRWEYFCPGDWRIMSPCPLLLREEPLVLQIFNHDRSILESSIFYRRIKSINEILAHRLEFEFALLALDWISL